MSIVNLLVIIAMGVILADLIKNYKGTEALFTGIGNMWKVSVNGMLGKTS